MKTNIAIVILMLMASVGSAIAEDSPAMWFEPTDGSCDCGNSGTVDLMVNTSANESVMQAHVHFDPTCINITNVDYTGSPWQPPLLPGWSNQGSYIIMGTAELTGMTSPGVYKVATLTVECLCMNGTCVSPLDITDTVTANLIPYNGTWTCTEEEEEPEDAIVSIGDGEGNVTIPIMINSSIPVGAADITLEYNASLVSIASIENGTMELYAYNHDDGIGWLRMAGIQINSTSESEFVFADITFAPVGPDGTCTLDLTVIDLYGDTNMTLPIAYTEIDGTYTYTQVVILCGDVNDDGVVDMSDVMMLAKHIVGVPGFETINEAVSDVNGDGQIDIADCMFLAKHVVGNPDFADLRC